MPILVATRSLSDSKLRVLNSALTPASPVLVAVSDDRRVADKDFSTRGGVAYVDRQVGTWGSGFKSHRSATWPFARLRVGTQDIVISSVFGEFRVTRTNLVSISRFGRVLVLADGFKFVAHGHHEAVIFWAVGVRKVLEELHRHGWAVEDA
jgi:hypothetical protein